MNHFPCERAPLRSCCFEDCFTPFGDARINRAATDLPHGDVEVLCSWNGTKEAEEEIINHSGYEFLVAQRDAYHFASNMNQLAHHANGEVLAFVNDDVVLDDSSLDAGLSCLFDETSTLCVGALLRTPDGQLQHGGMGFDLHHTPYHIARCW